MSEPTQSPSTIKKLADWAKAQEEAEREMAAADAVAAPPVEPAAAPARRGGGALRLFGALAFLALCAAGPVASGVYFWTKPKPPEGDKPKEPAPVVEALPGDAIDALVRAGAFTEALAACRRPGPELSPAQARARKYREAVCLEALGRLKEADELYRKAEPPDGDRAAWARALLGRARCALTADDLETAEKLVNQVALRSGHPDCAGAHVAEECAFLRARLLAAKLGPVRALDPFDPGAVAWPGFGGSHDVYFEWLPPDTKPSASAGLPGGPTAFEVRRTERGFEVTAHAAERPLADTLRALADAAGLKLQIAQAVEAPLAKHTTAVDVAALPLADALAALLGTAGCEAKLDDDTLTVGPQGRPTPDAVEAALGRALAVAPGHPRAAAMKVWSANFAAAVGRVHDATKHYQELLDAPQPPAEAAHAAYNAGLLELKAGALASARSRFIDLVDRAPGTKWADYGWWWAGRINLDGGDTAAARKAFRTAGGGKTREVGSAVVLGTCAVALLDGNDAEAKAALESARVSPREAHGALGTALDALLRYRAAPSDSRKSTLLKALAECGDARALGPAGAYLAGRVYRDLGLPDRMAALYDRATDGVRGPLAVRMTFDAATWYDLSERADLARQRYRAIAVTDPKGFGPLAELRLAAMSLRAGATDDCVRRCRALLDRPGVERTDVLALLGRAYEAKRNYRAAAECFGGRAPAE